VVPDRVLPAIGSAQRTPSPVIGSLDESGPQGVSFDVPADQQKVLVILDGKTLETALIDLSLATGPVAGMHLSMLLMRISNVERASRPVHRSVGPGDPTYTTVVVLLVCMSETTAGSCSCLHLPWAATQNASGWASTAKPESGRRNASVPRRGKTGGSSSPTSATVPTLLPNPPTVAGCSPCHGPPQPTSTWTPSHHQQRSTFIRRTLTGELWRVGRRNGSVAVISSPSGGGLDDGARRSRWNSGSWKSNSLNAMG
jgi:hypothetical protein